MKRFKISAIVLCAVFLCSINIFGQDSLNTNNYYKYKNSVEKLYEDVIEGYITKDNAISELDSLKKITYGSLKEFSRVLNKTIPGIINKLGNDKKKIDTSLVYTVKAGDNLWKIAQKTLKNSFKWMAIFNANRDQLSEPDVIFPGQKLIIPLPHLKLTQNNSKSQNNTKKLISKISTKTLDSLLALKKALNSQNNTANNQLGINGLIVDETDSKIGHDFYDIFYSNWQPPRNMQDYTITISEKPLPQLGTRITILINDTPVFQRFVQPRYEIIEKTALQGAATAYSYLENYTQIQKQLQGEDLKGTGIY